MKNTKVELIPLTADDREQFILDNQWAFKYGAMMEFGERDDHLDGNGEIISRTTIEKSIDNPKSETYRILLDSEKVGGLILPANGHTGSGRQKGCVLRFQREGQQIPTVGI